MAYTQETPAKKLTPLVSVLMTVYNEEQYLQQSIESVLSQSFPDLELVIVDDASTDASAGIIAKYSAADPKVRVIANKQNIGLVESRIKAFHEARGRYITIVDGDDFIAPDALKDALESINRTGADIAVLELMMFHSSNDIRPYPTAKCGETINGHEAFRLCVEGKLHGLCVTHRRYYERLPFDGTCRLYSDDNTPKCHYYIAQKVCFCHGRYYYRQHESSETHKISASRFDYLLANISLRNTMLTLKADSKSLATLEMHRWKNIVAHYKLLRSNKYALGITGRAYARKAIATALKTIDFKLLPLKLKVRPPYWPTHSMAIFGIFQGIYYALHAPRRIFRQ